MRPKPIQPAARWPAGALLATGSMVLAALASMGEGALRAVAQEESPAKLSILSSLRARRAPAPVLSEPADDVIAGASVRRDARLQIRRVRGRVAVPGARSAAAAAFGFLRGRAKTLGLSSTLAELRLVRQANSLTGSHFTYRQVYAGLPVFNGKLTVHTGRDYGVRAVNQDLAPVTAQPAPGPAANAGAAIQAALRAVGAPGGASAPPLSEAGIWLRDGAPLRAWRICFPTRAPAADWEVIVGAGDGAILSLRNRMAYATGSGLVFAPNPITTTGNARLEDQSDRDSATLREQLVRRALEGLDGSGYLTGVYATTQPTTDQRRAFEPSLTFEYERADNRFEEVMCYYWGDTAARYIHSLGLDDVLTAPLRFNVNGDDADNSFFSPYSRTITTGTGGVDDAEDADILCHEIGHAIHEDQTPGWGDGAQSAAMGEGFGDYWAGSMLADIGPRAAKWNVFVGEWDASSYSSASPPYLRRLDSTKRYPEGMTDDVHADGEIWSACLWKIRQLVGRQRADTMILESHFTVPTDGSFADGAESILTANGALYGGADEAAIRQVFYDRGILAPPGSGRLSLSATELGLTLARSKARTTQKLVLRNTGRGALSGQVGSLRAPFRVLGGGSFVLAPRGSRTVTVEFTPARVGSYNEVLTITSDDPQASTVDVAVTARYR